MLQKTPNNVRQHTKGNIIMRNRTFTTEAFNLVLVIYAVIVILAYVLVVGV